MANLNLMTMKRLILYLTRPFKVIGYNKTSFFVWVLCTFLGGNLGVIINIVIRHYLYEMNLWESVSYDLCSGTFYVFVIAMLASSFGTLLIDFWTKENNDFKQPKIIWLSVTFFLCTIISIFYSAYTSSLMRGNVEKYFDFWQIVFLIVGLFLGIYSYCLLLMDAQNEDFWVLSDKYEQKENKSIQKMSKESIQMSEDSNGVKLS